MLDGAGLLPHQTGHRPNDHASHQVTQHRPQPEAGGQRHVNHGGNEVDKGLDEVAGLRLYLDHSGSLQTYPSMFIKRFLSSLLIGYSAEHKLYDLNYLPKLFEQVNQIFRGINDKFIYIKPEIIVIDDHILSGLI